MRLFMMLVCLGAITWAAHDLMLLEEDAASGISVAEQQELFKDVTEKAKKATKEATKTTKKALALATKKKKADPKKADPNKAAPKYAGDYWAGRGRGLVPVDRQKCKDTGKKCNKWHHPAKWYCKDAARTHPLHSNSGYVKSYCRASCGCKFPPPKKPCRNTHKSCWKKPPTWKHSAKYYCKDVGKLGEFVRKHCRKICACHPDNSDPQTLHDTLYCIKDKSVKDFCPKILPPKPVCKDTGMRILRKGRRGGSLPYCNPGVWNLPIGYSALDSRSWAHKSTDFCKWAASSRRRAEASNMKKYCPATCGICPKCTFEVKSWAWICDGKKVAPPKNWNAPKAEDSQKTRRRRQAPGGE
jgi:DNA-binding protein H-NS